MSSTTWLDSDGNIRVRIEGYLDAAEGERTIHSVLELLGPKPRDLIFEATSMTGYRRGVRATWQTALLDQRGQLRRFILIGGNSVVRMGLSMIAMSLGVPLVVHEAELPIEADAPMKRGRARSGSRPITRPMSRPLLGPVRRTREDSRPNR